MKKTKKRHTPSAPENRAPASKMAGGEKSIANKEAFSDFVAEMVSPKPVGNMKNDGDGHGSFPISSDLVPVQTLAESPKVLDIDGGGEIRKPLSPAGELSAQGKDDAHKVFDGLPQPKNNLPAQETEGAHKVFDGLPQQKNNLPAQETEGAHKVFDGLPQPKNTKERGPRTGPIPFADLVHDEHMAPTNAALGESSRARDLDVNAQTENLEEGKKSDQAPKKFGNKTFVELFAKNRTSDKGMNLPLFKMQGYSFKFEEEDIVDMKKKWGFCLMGYFTQRHPGRDALVKLCNSWNVPYEIVPDINGWIVFKFKTEEDRNLVLRDGPYSVYGRSLVLKLMPEGFRFGEDDSKHVPVWITLPHLPLELYNARALGKIGSCIGIPLTTDKLTQTMERASYARLLVEVDVSKDLVRSLNLNMRGNEFVQDIVYENEPKYCTKCKHIGHTILNCMKGKEPKKVGADSDIAKDGQVGKIRTTNPSKAPNVAAKEKVGTSNVAASNVAGDAPVAPKLIDKGKAKVDDFALAREESEFLDDDESDQENYSDSDDDTHAENPFQIVGRNNKIVGQESDTSSGTSSTQQGAKINSKVALKPSALKDQMKGASLGGPRLK